jgi:hypothetical protein
MELWPAIMAPRAFQFLETTPRCHELSKLRQAGTTNRLNGGWAGCHDRFSPLRPVGGEMFLLTAPLMERPLPEQRRSPNTEHDERLFSRAI